MLDYNYDINITILKKPSKWAEELAGQSFQLIQKFNKFVIFVSPSNYMQLSKKIQQINIYENSSQENISILIN